MFIVVKLFNTSLIAHHYHYGEKFPSSAQRIPLACCSKGHTAMGIEPQPPACKIWAVSPAPSGEVFEVLFIATFKQ